MRVGVVLLAVLAVFVVLPSPLGVCAKRGRRGAWEDAEPEEGGVGMPEKLSSLNINDLTKLRMKELRALLRSWGVECEECTSQVCRAGLVWGWDAPGRRRSRWGMGATTPRHRQNTKQPSATGRLRPVRAPICRRGRTSVRWKKRQRHAIDPAVLACPPQARRTAARHCNKTRNFASLHSPPPPSPLPNPSWLTERIPGKGHEVHCGGQN